MKLYFFVYFCFFQTSFIYRTLQNVQKLQTLTQSMTQYMKWQETKQDMAKHSKDY